MAATYTLYQRHCRCRHGSDDHYSLVIDGQWPQGSWSLVVQRDISNKPRRHPRWKHLPGDCCYDKQRPPEQLLLGVACWRLRLQGQLGRDDCVQERRRGRLPGPGGLPVATTNFTSASTLLADLTAGNWERYAAGSTNRGAYALSTDYFKGDLVQTGTAPNLDHFICLTDHTSDASADPGTAP